MKKPKKETLNLMYKSIAKYIEEAGGTAIVLGGISIMTKTSTKKNNYTFCVDITGKCPIN